MIDNQHIAQFRICRFSSSPSEGDREATGNYRTRPNCVLNFHGARVAASGERGAALGHLPPPFTQDTKQKFPGLKRPQRCFRLRGWSIPIASLLDERRASPQGNPACRLRFQDRRQRHFHPARRGDELDAQELALADADGPGLLRDRTDGHGLRAFRHRPLWRRGDALLAATMRRHDRRRHGHLQDGARGEAHLRSDARAEMGHRDGRLRLERRHVSLLRRACRASTSFCRWTFMSRAVRHGPKRSSRA